MSAGQDERLAWLRLARTDAVGASTFAHLIGRFGTAAAALEKAPALARRGGRSETPRIPSQEEARREIEEGEALGARLVLGCDADFPGLLAVLDSPPPLIWIRGEAELLSRRAVAVVGARAASAAGRKFARDLASDLGAMGFVVVSGLARGIDAAAHEGSLATGAAAVLAGGIDDLYPPENIELGRSIGQEGCLVSERPPGYRAKAADFPRRNRIISGLSLGVVVVEAEERSGSLITARLAGEQGRDVFAVPGSPLDPRARGANGLLRQGAWLVETAEDVRRVLDEGLPSAIIHAEPTLRRAKSEVSGDLVERLIQSLSPTPTSVDLLARELGATASEVSAALVELALTGRAALLAGGLAVGL